MLNHPYCTSVELEGRALHFTAIPARFRAKREQLKWVSGPLPHSQGQDMAVSVLYVPHSLSTAATHTMFPACWAPVAAGSLLLHVFVCTIPRGETVMGKTVFWVIEFILRSTCRAFLVSALRFCIYALYDSPREKACSHGPPHSAKGRRTVDCGPSIKSQLDFT